MKYQELTVVGVANLTTLDAGLVSLVEEPRTIRAVLINFDTHEGNVIEGWIGTERVMAVYDYIFDTQENVGADTPPFSTVKTQRLPIDIEIPPGQTFKVGVRCGAAANDIFGAYEYDKTGA